MIRCSEVVLPGHPDKFCDQVADAIVAACAAKDPDAYCQVEVGAWRDQVWVSGGFTVPRGEDVELAPLVAQVVDRVGYRLPDGKARPFQVLDRTCHCLDDPRSWSHKVNDQSICMGWAGYDVRTGHHAPEHFLAHHLRKALWAAVQGGTLQGQGPDGKLLVLLAEEAGAWRLEQVLVTLQQARRTPFPAFIRRVEAVLRGAYERARAADPRWVSPWEGVALTLNPNGPLLEGGTDGDNGQTGRKLAMDFYGPRVGQGGGALSGKHFSHIDRIGSYAAREAAIQAVQAGATSCRVLVAYAPNCPEPLEVVYELEGPGRSLPRSFFSHDHLRRHYEATRVQASWAQGDHFWDPAAPWNHGCPDR